MKIKAWGLLFALALLVASSLDSLGQGNRPPPPQGQPAQQQTTTDQRGTENSPVVVRVLPTQENEAKAKADAGEHDEKQKLDRDTFWLSAATVVIIFLQLLIFAVQAYFLWGTLRATAIAAGAAKAAAEAIHIVERPYIFIWGMVGSAPAITFSSSDGDTPPSTLREEAYFTYCVSNRGKLAAVVQNVSIACGYEYHGMYPPLIGMGDHYLLQVPIISSDQDKEQIPFRRPWGELDLTNKAAGFREGLIFRVVITYRGPFTKGHETSQCWRYVRSLNGFAEVSDSSYTYSR